MEGSTHPDTAVMGLTSSARLPAQTLPARPSPSRELKTHGPETELRSHWHHQPHNLGARAGSNATKPRIQCALTQWNPHWFHDVRQGAKAQDFFSNTATWLSLPEVKRARSQPAQRSRSRKPAILAMRSSSDGQTYR